MENLIDHDTMESGERKIDLEAGRRAFIQSLGIAALGGVAATATGMSIGAAQAANGVADVDVLNFALNLEYLEAEFYLRGTTGSGLPDRLTGDNPGQVYGGSMVPQFSKPFGAYAREIANDERLHVEFLRKALGSAAVPRPKIDLKSSFTTLARAAGLIGPRQGFDPFANEDNFILAAYIFEDVGVSAYHGAARYLTDNNTYLQVAAGILATEAYHSGLIRTVLFVEGKGIATDKISALRQSLGPVDSSTGSGGVDAGVGTAPMGNIVLTDPFGVAFERQPRAVLNVVYGAQGASKGLFFPAGLNGNIK